MLPEESLHICPVEFIESRNLDFFPPDHCSHGFTTSARDFQRLAEVGRRDDPEVVFLAQLLDSSKDRAVAGDEPVYSMANARRQLMVLPFLPPGCRPVTLNPRPFQNLLAGSSAATLAVMVK